MIDTFCNSRAAVGRAPGTVAWYRRLLGAFERQSGLTLPDGDAACVESFLAARRADGCQPSTIAAHYRALRAYYSWAERRGLIVSSPMRTIDAPRVPHKRARRMEITHYHALQTVCGGPLWLDARDRLILMLGFYSGLRVGELSALDVGDLDLPHEVLSVRRGKGGDARVVPLYPDARVALIEYLYARPAWSGPELLLASDGGRGVRGRLTPWGIRQMLARRCAQAGIPRLNPHALRHGFATTMLNAGASMSAVSNMLGHTSTALTERVYAKWLEDGLLAEYRVALKRLRGSK